MVKLDNTRVFYFIEWFIFPRVLHRRNRRYPEIEKKPKGNCIITAPIGRPTGVRPVAAARGRHKCCIRLSGCCAFTTRAIFNCAMQMRNNNNNQVLLQTCALWPVVRSGLVYLLHITEREREREKIIRIMPHGRSKTERESEDMTRWLCRRRRRRCRHSQKLLMWSRNSSFVRPLRARII